MIPGPCVRERVCFPRQENVVEAGFLYFRNREQRRTTVGGARGLRAEPQARRWW